MATPSKATYVTVEAMIRWDASTKRVQITSNDPELRPGFVVDLKPDSAADKAAKAMLRKHGKPPYQSDADEWDEDQRADVWQADIS